MWFLHYNHPTVYAFRDYRSQGQTIQHVIVDVASHQPQSLQWQDTQFACCEHDQRLINKIVGWQN